mmetsp:Transcript_67836/g.182608  ORF Transcript_67836/g.182608 Transcript_67836/m.182608 type:complete len:119 (+) Transcript_67836:82-438(+)
MPCVALAGLCFLVGYVPWFLTTVAAFEGEDANVRERTPLQFFSREDLSSPLVLVTKVAMLLVGCPLATLTFFVPYICYVAILRLDPRLLFVHRLCRSAELPGARVVGLATRVLHGMGS